MKKENLILVHSFPSNSILLKGLVEYIDDYCNVHLIDLPGFTKKVSSLSKITLENYSKFVEKKIKEFDLDSYLIGGISFGFLVINNAKLDKKCKGIVALEPYTDSNCIKMSFIKKLVFSLILNIIISLKLSSKLWKKELFLRLGFFRDHSKKAVDIIFSHMDGRTFFETAKLILKNRQKCKFQKLPYILIINKNDKTVKYDYLVRLFEDNTEKLLIINETIPHFPKHLTENYFKTRFPEVSVKRGFDFIEKIK